MRVDVAPEPGLMTDASLVDLSRAGDREAFCEIVARYQSPICALAYSACGNVAQSEDVAQQVFLTAWCKLESLHEPGKFKAWLYGIARNVIHAAFRQSTRNPVAGAESLDSAANEVCSTNKPDAETISNEEQAILWGVLSGLPQMYREPMVLFYRQNESVAQVAEALEISEEAVRQRLARGRALLNERVTKVIQNGLRCSGPSDRFAITVAASLCGLSAATSAHGATVTLGAASNVASQGSGFATACKSILSAAATLLLPAGLGSFFGYKLRQDAAGLPHQRLAATRFWRVLGLSVWFCLILPVLLTFTVTPFLHAEPRAAFLSVMTWWLSLAYPLTFGALVGWAWRRGRKQPSVAVGTLNRGPNGSSGLHDRPSQARGLRRLVMASTVAAAVIALICILDTNSDVRKSTTRELQSLVNTTASENLRVSILKRHHRSLWREYPSFTQQLWVEVQQNGKSAKYIGEADEMTLALVRAKGVPCPIYTQGRDFEVLGTPGRLLVPLAAFITGLGAVYLFKRPGLRAGETASL